MKPGVGRITQTMADATTRIKRGADALATRWLLERGWKEVEAEAAYNDWASLSAAVPANQRLMPLASANSTMAAPPPIAPPCGTPAVRPPRRSPG